jgi:hypothetical protein
LFTNAQKKDGWAFAGDLTTALVGDDLAVISSSTLSSVGDSIRLLNFVLLHELSSSWSTVEDELFCRASEDSGDELCPAVEVGVTGLAVLTSE